MAGGLKLFDYRMTEKEHILAETIIEMTDKSELFRTGLEHFDWSEIKVIPTGDRPHDFMLARETGEVQFTEYGLSGICIMQLSGLLAPRRGPKRPVVALDLFPALSETELAALFAQRIGLLGSEAAEFWLGLLPAKLGRALWADAGLPENARALPASAWPKLAATAKCWKFEGLTPCGWKQAQTTGGGLLLDEVEDDFQFKGCPGLYFVGETLDCAGSCGGYNLHWAFGSGIIAGRAAAKLRKKKK